MIEKGKIPVPSMGEVLKEDYMKPLDMSAYMLAKLIDVPVSRIQDILKDKRQVTTDTALRFSKLFSTSINFWLNMQADINSRNAEKRLSEYNFIKPLT